MSKKNGESIDWDSIERGEVDIMKQIKKLDRKELESELLLKYTENIDLNKSIKSLKRRMSVASSYVIQNCARFLEDDEKAECLYALSKFLFKEIQNE